MFNTVRFMYFNDLAGRNKTVMFRNGNEADFLVANLDCSKKHDNRI